MTWEDSCLIARARVLVLHAMLDAGFQPTLRQIKRALQPVLGDLVPVDVDARGRPRQRRDQAGRYVESLAAGGARVLMSGPSGSCDRTAAVDDKTNSPAPRPT